MKAVSSPPDPPQDRAYGPKEVEIAPDRARRDPVGSALGKKVVHGERHLGLAECPPETPRTGDLFVPRHGPGAGTDDTPRGVRSRGDPTPCAKGLTRVRVARAHLSGHHPSHRATEAPSPRTRTSHVSRADRAPARAAPESTRTRTPLHPRLHPSPPRRRREREPVVSAVMLDQLGPEPPDRAESGSRNTLVERGSVA